MKREREVNIDIRSFLFTRGYAIKDTRDAIVELLTNSIDAYNQLERPMSNVYVSIHDADDGVYLRVVDNATGVPHEKMEECFLSVGKLTSLPGARGFFSTGTKNITVLGDVTFISVRDGRVSSVTHTTNGVGIVDDRSGEALTKMTSQMRDDLRIPKNGVCVVLKYNKGSDESKWVSSNYASLFEGVPKIATLRDMFSDDNVNIMFGHTTSPPVVDVNKPWPWANVVQYNRATYTRPSSSLLVDVRFRVPDFEHYSARLTIRKSNKPIRQPTREQELEFGFLVRDGNTIHEANTLEDRNRWDPYMPFILGELRCDGIGNELKRYDNGETERLVVDPSRVGGVNKSHPLYRSLMKVCSPRLDSVLRDVRKDSMTTSIRVENLDSIVDELEKIGIDILKGVGAKFEVGDKGKDVITESIKETKEYIDDELFGVDGVVIMSNGDGEDGDIFSMGSDGAIASRDSVSDCTFVKKGDVLERVARKDSDGDARAPAKSSLSIEFINDINFNEKYLVDMSGPIRVKVNLHNEVVASKLSRSRLDDDVDLGDKTDHDALTFLESVISSALTDIVTSSSITNADLGNDPVVTARRAISERVRVESIVEPPIFRVFESIISKQKESMKRSLEIEMASVGVGRDAIDTIASRLI